MLPENPWSNGWWKTSAGSLELKRSTSSPTQSFSLISKRGRKIIRARIQTFRSRSLMMASDDDNKLGAIGDINLVLTRESAADSDLLVIAGDNLFRESLAGFVDYARKTEATVGVYDVADAEAIKKYGVVTVDADGVITHFEEKPKEPKSSLAAIALYFYSKDMLSLFTTYVAAGNNPDQPGLFLQWLYPRKPVNTFEIKGRWLDIGSKETLENADKIFAKA